MKTAAQQTTTRLAALASSVMLWGSVLSWATTAPEPERDVAVWSARSASMTSREQFEQAITPADYLIIGEIHDNPHHHRLQAELLAHFADSHRGPVSVGFEQLAVDQQPLLDTFFQQDNVAAEAVGEAVNWSGSGWPDYTMYQPLFAVALARKLAVVPLMFSSEITRDIMADGAAAALPQATLSLLRPDTLLSPEERRVVERDMQEAHCGKLPESMLPAMVDVQVARDAFMAHRIVQAGGRAVLITGNGHARRDRGIPRFLQRLRPDARILVVTLLERVEGQTARDQLRQQAPPAVTDFALLTPAHPRDDPCLAFQ